MEAVVFDLETTGLSPYNNEIIQIAGVKIRTGKIYEKEFFSTYVKPQGRISSFISSYTGITEAHVKSAPSASEALKEFSQFVGSSLLIAHNGQRFDMPFIRETCAREKLLTREIPFIDSISFSRKMWVGQKGHGLDAVMGRLNLNANENRRHDARGDVRILAEAVCIMWSKLCPTCDTWPVLVNKGVVPKSDNR